MGSLRIALSLAVLAACGSRGLDEEALRHAAAKRKVAPGSLRVTPRSDLTTPGTEFFLVTGAGQKPLTVIVRPGEPAFDAETPGGFDRIARNEDAARRVAKLGAERVALWFSAFDRGTCGAPLGDAVKFATVETLEDGVRIRYPFQVAGGTRTCTVDLAGDGSLRRAQAEALAAGAQRIRWASDS
jgi:hypothetical protein